MTVALHVNAAREDAQQIVDIPQRQWRLDVEHHRKADDLGALLEPLEGGGFDRSPRLAIALSRLKPSLSDRTAFGGLS